MVLYFTGTGNSRYLARRIAEGQAMLGIKGEYGKNAILTASSFEEGATMRQRNGQIGGHSAGGPDGKLQK